MFNIIKSLFGDSNDREVKRLRPVVDQINGLEPKYQAMSDAELGGMTEALRARFKGGETLAVPAVA